MGNLYDEGTFPELEVKEYRRLLNDDPKDGRQEESDEAASDRLLLIWAALAVLLGFLSWLNESMKSDRNFGRRVVRNYAEGLAFSAISVVLLVTMILNNDLPIGELSIPILTLIASVTYGVQYFTRFARVLRADRARAS